MHLVHCEVILDRFCWTDEDALTIIVPAEADAP
jgi:hypothetical protein